MMIWIVKRETNLGSLFSFNCYREQYSVNKQLLQDGLDMLIPATGLGYLSLDDGAVGLIG